jgi:hypothetical protein
MIEIKHRITGEVLFKVYAHTLRGADLRDKNLRGADLRHYDLRDSDLSYSDLRDSDLSYSDLRGTILYETDLSGATFNGTIIPSAEQAAPLLAQVAQAALATPAALQMRAWHSACGTAHCIAGWACALAENGAELEKQHGSGNAGLLLLGAEAASHFYDDTKAAAAWLRTNLPAGDGGATSAEEEA